MLKKLCSVLLLLALLCGCSGSSELDIDSAVDALREGDAFPEAMVEVELHTALMMYRLADYGVTEDDIKHARVFVPQSVISDEMAFFEVSSEEIGKRVAEALAARVKTQAAAFSGYGPEQVPKLNESVLKQDGVYVYLVVASDYDAVSAALK